MYWDKSEGEKERVQKTTYQKIIFQLKEMITNRAVPESIKINTYFHINQQKQFNFNFKYSKCDLHLKVWTASWMLYLFSAAGRFWNCVRHGCDICASSRRSPKHHPVSILVTAHISWMFSANLSRMFSTKAASWICKKQIICFYLKNFNFNLTVV